jgi:predicted transcriptional regulator
MSKCSICLSPNVATIDDLLDGGASQKDVAQQFQVSRFAVSRHARHGKRVPVTPESDDDSLEARAILWRERADHLWHQATADADCRAMAQAVSAGLRSVELAHRQEQRAAESAPETEDDGKLTIQDFDRIVERWEKIQETLGSEKAREAAANAERMRLPNLMGVFYDCVDDAELRTLIETTTRDYKNSKDERQHESVSQIATN